MSLRVLAATSPGEVRVAVTDADELLDYAIWRPGMPDGVDDLYLGRVIARVPAMAGAFVALPESEGFLPDSEGGRAVGEGGLLAVRITRAAQGGKGPRLTAKLAAADLAIAGSPSGPLRLLRRGPGAVERLAKQRPEAPVLIDDAALLAALRPTLKERLALVRKAFDEGVAGQVAALAGPVVSVPGGGRLHIHPTPALIAIDVDVAAGVSESGGKAAAAQEEWNRSIMPMLARQIRLRNLTGAILVDFAGMAVRRRALLGPALAAALADDPLHPRLLGFTKLGLAEIVRPRVHPPLHELLAGPQAAALRALRQAEAELEGAAGQALALRAAPDVVAALQADSQALPDFVRRTGRVLPVRSDPMLASGAWRLERAG